MKWKYYNGTKGIFKATLFRKKRTVWWGYNKDLKEWIRIPKSLLALIDTHTQRLNEEQAFLEMV